MSKLNLPQWTETHAVLLDQLIMDVRAKMLHHTAREALGTADQEDIAAAELYTGILNTLITMRRPVGCIGVLGHLDLRETVAEACAEIRRGKARTSGTRFSPSYLAMCARMGIDPQDVSAPLAGVDELRSARDWANATREDEHDYLTAEELLENYRRACADDPGTV